MASLATTLSLARDGVVGVTAGARLFSAFARSYFPSPYVLVIRDYFHMKWINAMPNSAEVVDYESLGD
jgi:hypothetical protein